MFQTHQRVAEGKNRKRWRTSKFPFIGVWDNPAARDSFAILDFTKHRDLLIREDSMTLPEINKNIPVDIHFELKQHGTGFSSHIEISRKDKLLTAEE